MPRNPNKIDFSRGFPKNFEAFEGLKDTRKDGHTRHHFGEIIFMAFTCIVCGVKSYELMEEFCEIRHKWFRKWLSLPNGIPSYNTFSRVMEAVDPVLFSQCIITHLRLAGVEVEDDQIAIDGKALRGSRTKDDRHIHAVSARACEKGLTLAQSFVEKKSNEITAIPELLKMLNLQGAVVTIDAMGTQHKIAEQIIDARGDYVLRIKGNQGDLHKELIDQFDFAARQLDVEKLTSENWSVHTSEEKNRGRLEMRQTIVCYNLDWMDPEIRATWKALECIILVQRQVLESSGNWRTETHYYMSSLKEVKAKQFQKYIRSHWRIENSCHWVLDTLFREDHNQTGKRNAAKNLSTLRRMALMPSRERRITTPVSVQAASRKNSFVLPKTKPTSKRSSPLCRDPEKSSHIFPLLFSSRSLCGLHMIPSSFEEIALAAPIQRALKEQDYHTPSPIQAQSIPTLLKGQDLLGIAQTGTGKTAAFSLPILHSLHENQRRAPRKGARVLVLTPTRELATQISQSFESYGKHIRFSKTLIYGGVGKNPQVRAMKNGVDILVACPGRLLDHIQEGDVDLSKVEFFVLDEVDRMLDMGFLRDVKKIIAELPRKRQSLFFSATLAPSIKELANSILYKPELVSIAPKVTTAEKVEQRVCFVTRENKQELLVKHLSEQPKEELTIIFARTKHGSDKLCRWINQRGFSAEAIHGNRSQPQRERTLAKFKKGTLPILVATDVAARGVDVRDVTLVINYDLPNEAEAYVHRIGRTGRADASGHAVSYCAPEEHEFFIDIEKLIKQRIPVEDDHPGHDAELADLHARGLKSRLSTRDNGGKKGGGGGRGRGQNRGGGGGGRRPQSNSRSSSSEGRSDDQPRRRRRRRR